MVLILPGLVATLVMPSSIETLIGFDFGIKKIGVALANTLIMQAKPLRILRPVTKQQRFALVAQVLQEWQPDKVIVGLPLTMTGAEQEASAASRRFARQIEGRFHIPVVLIDERGSSMQAQQVLGNNTDDDAVAAAIILQRYLDGQRG